MVVKYNISLKSLNTFGIDAHAAEFVEVHSLQELNTLFLDKRLRQPLLILGGGSNMLFTKDFAGLVVKMNLKGIELLSEDEHYVVLKAGAGVVWHDFVLNAVAKKWGGIENMSLIPGTVGAAPIQNIGAYGVELKDVFVSLEALNLETGEIEVFDKEACLFGYRNSFFKQAGKGRYIIVSVAIRLSKQPEFNISYGAIKDTIEELGIKELSLKAVSDAVIHIRRSKLPDPDVLGNAGSFFKNPEIPTSQYEKLKTVYADMPHFPTHEGFVKVPAGWLIEQCGWKGKKVGHTGVHAKQALVLVNYGGANGHEVWQLALEVQKSVKEKFGIDIENEVNFI